MNSINPGNIVLNFTLFQTQEIVYSLFFSFFLFIVIIIFKSLAVKYKGIALERDRIYEIKTRYLRFIEDLNVENESFFYELNLLLRSFLEDYNSFPGITKMTKTEILSRNIKSNDFKNLLENFEKYEFGHNKTVGVNIRQDSKNKSLKIIKNI